MWKYFSKLMTPCPKNCEIYDSNTKLSEPPKLYEVVVTTKDRGTITYSDLSKYKFYLGGKKDNLIIDLAYKNGDIKHVYLSDWTHVEGRNQAIKLPDIEQVKTAWDIPTEKKLPEFPITLDPQ